MNQDRWPTLPVSEWQDTAATLHRWTQIVGKTRLSLTPLVNHWWNSTLYVSARGLTTGVMHSGDVALDVGFDFIDHALEIHSSRANTVRLPLEAQSVAEFYKRYVEALRGIGVELHISASPNEVEDATPFFEDETHHSYDPGYANRFWRILLESDRVFTEFRGRFLGKASPSHFFWGGRRQSTRAARRTAPTTFRSRGTRTS